MVADGVLNLGIDLNAWPWIWLSVAVIFALIELTVLGGSFVLLPFAVSSFVTSILSFYKVPIEVQWATFVFGGAALFAGTIRWLKKFVNENDTPPGVGAERLVGLIGIVTDLISPDDVSRHGRVNVVGESWGALAEGGITIEPGTKVLITAMQGTRVVVRPAMAEQQEDSA